MLQQGEQCPSRCEVGDRLQVLGGSLLWSVCSRPRGHRPRTVRRLRLQQEVACFDGCGMVRAHTAAREHRIERLAGRMGIASQLFRLTPSPIGVLSLEQLCGGRLLLISREDAPAECLRSDPLEVRLRQRRGVLEMADRDRRKPHPRSARLRNRITPLRLNTGLDLPR